MVFSGAEPQGEGEKHCSDQFCALPGLLPDALLVPLSCVHPVLETKAPCEYLGDLRPGGAGHLSC